MTQSSFSETSWHLTADAGNKTNFYYTLPLLRHYNILNYVPSVQSWVTSWSCPEGLESACLRYLWIKRIFKHNRWNYTVGFCRGLLKSWSQSQNVVLHSCHLILCKRATPKNGINSGCSIIQANPCWNWGLGGWEIASIFPSLCPLASLSCHDSLMFWLVSTVLI